MKTNTKIVTIIIDQCDHCPYFCEGEYSYSCKYHNRDVKYNLTSNCFLIPDWCEVDKYNDFKGQIETLKEQLNNANHQFIVRNFEG